MRTTTAASSSPAAARADGTAKYRVHRYFLHTAMKNKIKIIYEDNHLLVCEKPVNMPVQADSSGDEDLLSTVKAYIKEKYSKPGEVYLGLVHRLDRPVGGVMVFARTSKAAARLTESFKNRKTKKRYAAIVSGSPCSSAELECDLLRDEQNNISRVVRPNTPGAKTASLEYVSTVTKNGFTLLDVLLHTGRHHQIRAQLAWSGCPIFGDQRYNRAARVGQQIALYAYSLTIEHPTLRESMTFTCIPHGAKFDEFSDECAALAAGVRCAYIDNNLICVNKSSGISCTVEDGGNDTLEARLNSAFGKVYPLHRLDAPTSGLVLFARNAKTAAVLGEAIRQRKIKKFYQAEVFGAPPAASGSLRLFGRKDSERAFVQVFTKPVSNSFEMNTDYRLLSSNGGTSTLELLLITGKTHQIRASLAHIGCPIIGDDKYGDRVGNRSFPAGLRLTATRIVFPNKLDRLEYLCGKSIEIEPPYNTQLIKNQL